MTDLQKKLTKWNKNTDSLAKIQYGYAALAVVLFLLAAIISLVHAGAGQMVLFWAFISGLTFIANGVLWSLVQTFVVPRIDAWKKRQK